MAGFTPAFHCDQCPWVENVPALISLKKEALPSPWVVEGQLLGCTEKWGVGTWGVCLQMSEQSPVLCAALTCPFCTAWNLSAQDCRNLGTFSTMYTVHMSQPSEIMYIFTSFKYPLHRFRKHCWDLHLCCLTCLFLSLLRPLISCVRASVNLW